MEKEGKKEKMQISKENIETGLKQLVEINFLKEDNGKYCYHESYKKTLLKCKGNNTVEILLDALWKVNYFKEAKSEKEIVTVINLLTLKNGKW